MESGNAFAELTWALHQGNTENGRVGVLTAMKLVKDHLNVDGRLTQATHSEEERISYLMNQLLSIELNL